MADKVFKHNYTCSLQYQGQYYVNSLPYAVECLKCKKVVSFGVCENCNGDLFIAGFATDKTQGLFCRGCDKGITRWKCSGCGCDNAIAKTFGTYEQNLGVAGSLAALCLIGGAAMLLSGFVASSGGALGLGIMLIFVFLMIRFVAK